MGMIVEYPSSHDEYEQGSCRYDNSWLGDASHSFGGRLIDLQIMFHVLLFLHRNKAAVNLTFWF